LNYDVVFGDRLSPLHLAFPLKTKLKFTKTIIQGEGGPLAVDEVDRLPCAKGAGIA